MKTAFIFALLAFVVLGRCSNSFVDCPKGTVLYPTFAKSCIVSSVTESRSLAESPEPHSLVKRGFLFNNGGSRCGYNFVCNLGPAQECYHSSGCCMRYVCN
uniref:Uncharacterized protein n=1 Tax=Branchiostoma floridae TaxID=7739 RepID=C3ZEE4_BRAFL|eukprot:XP_002593089.1 hypothetical protein BRAFLDRAFT_120189 [Branchiostoma floridae]